MENWYETIKAALHGDGSNWIDIDCQPLREIPLREEVEEIKACEVLARLVVPQPQGQSMRIVAGQFINDICHDQELMKLLDRRALKRLVEIHHDKAFTFHAVNLSAGSLNDTGTVQFVRDLITAHQIPAHYLCFEVTEQALFDFSKGLEVVNGLRALGCSIALDDVGTGQNSLLTFKDLEVDALKIDGSFVEEMLTNPKAYWIVQLLMELGLRLDLKVVAEFVSTKEIADTLAAMKGEIERCQKGARVSLKGQGNYIGLPLPCAEFAGSQC